MGKASAAAINHIPSNCIRVSKSLFPIRCQLYNMDVTEEKQ